MLPRDRNITRIKKKQETEKKKQDYTWKRFIWKRFIWKNPNNRPLKCSSLSRYIYVLYDPALHKLFCHHQSTSSLIWTLKFLDEIGWNIVQDEWIWSQEKWMFCRINQKEVWRFLEVVSGNSLRNHNQSLTRERGETDGK